MAIARIKMGAVLVGWVISLFIQFSVIAIAIVSLFASGFDFTSLSYGLSENPEIPLSAFIIFFSVAFVAFFTGGYVAGRMAALSGIANGGMIIATSILFLVLAVTFLDIVGKKLGANLIALACKPLAPFTPVLVGAFVLALAGSMLGGKLGEGYFARLFSALSNTCENKDENN